jgi:hypothetical protein
MRASSLLKQPDKQKSASPSEAASPNRVLFFCNQLPWACLAHRGILAFASRAGRK